MPHFDDLYGEERSRGDPEEERVRNRASPFRWLLLLAVAGWLIPLLVAFLLKGE